MQLADWLGYIERLHPKAWDLGLERVSAVADILDVGKPAPCTFLVAGTNGKGSVCAYIDGLCRELGLSTGLTTSPHLLRFNERVVINGVQATDDQLCDAFEAIEAARGDISLTYFEFAALAALFLFRRASVDVAVLEVGLGGRLDAMNLVNPDVSVITRIALDHQAWLGSSREAIGLEKAGIMRAGRPCVLGDRDMPASILDRAQEAGSELLVPGVDYDAFEQGPAKGTISIRADSNTITFEGLPRLKLPMGNAAAAIQAVYSAGLKPCREQIVRVLSRTVLPGRFQVVDGRRRTVLDVAHNPDAATYLLKGLKQMDFAQCHAVAAMYADKDYQGVIGLMSEVVNHWYFSELPEDRAAAPGDLAACVPSESGCGSRTYGKVSAAYEDAVRLSSRHDLIVVFGSFPVVANVLEILQVPV